MNIPKNNFNFIKIFLLSWRFLYIPGCQESVYRPRAAAGRQEGRQEGKEVLAHIPSPPHTQSSSILLTNLHLNFYEILYICDINFIMKTLYVLRPMDVINIMH